MSDTKKTGISRRDFTRAAATTAAAAATFGIVRPDKVKAAANGDTLKVGLLGCGNRGGGACMQMLQGNDNVLLVAMADVFQDRLDSKLESYETSNDSRVKSKLAVEEDMKFVGLDAYNQILATDIDIIIEGTLPYSRPKHLLAAANAGKHIFTEKPAAVDPAGIRTVLEAGKISKEKGLSWVAGTQRRHHSGYQESVKRIQDGEMGGVFGLRSYWCGGLPFVHDRQPDWSDLENCIRNWYAFNWICGDNIVEQHVHNLDVCNWIMDAYPTSVYASGGRAWKPEVPEFGDLWDHFSCDYEYGNGVHMISMSRHWDGTEGGVYETAQCGNGIWDSRKDLPPAEMDPYVQEHIDLVKSITGEGPKWHEAENVALSTLTAIMGRISAQTGRTITMEMCLEGKLPEEYDSIVPANLDFEVAYPTGPIPIPVDISKQKKYKKYADA